MILAPIFMGLSLVLSWIFSLFCKFLDFSMDYKHIFWRIRWNMAKKVSIKHIHINLQADQETLNLNEWFLRSTKDCDIVPYPEQTDYMNQVYIKLATIDNSFKRWICTTCMSVYLSLFPTFLSLILVYFYPEALVITLTFPLFVFFFINEQ